MKGCVCVSLYVWTKESVCTEESFWLNQIKSTSYHSFSLLLLYLLSLIFITFQIFTFSNFLLLLLTLFFHNRKCFRKLAPYFTFELLLYNLDFITNVAVIDLQISVNNSYAILIIMLYLLRSQLNSRFFRFFYLCFTEVDSIPLWLIVLTVCFVPRNRDFGV